MAASVRRADPYMSYGSVAYDPAYYPETQRREEALPRIRTRERAAAREHARVRPAGYVAPAAVIGFALVAVMAVLLLACYAQITQVSDQIVQLRREGETLSEENAKLRTQYELCFDLKTVEEQVAASGMMVQPQPGQIVTLNIAEADSAKFYTDQPSGQDGDLWSDVGETVDNLVEFFR